MVVILIQVMPPACLVAEKGSIKIGKKHWRLNFLMEFLQPCVGNHVRGIYDLSMNPFLEAIALTRRLSETSTGSYC